MPDDSHEIHPDAPPSLRPLFDRYSCRSFKNDPIPEEHLFWLKEALRWAPSAGNEQPWHFYVVHDKSVKKALAAAAYNQKFIAKAPVVFVVCSESERSIRRYGHRGATLYHLQDTAAAAQNLLIAATALGYGACWIGAFSEYPVEQTLNLDASLRPVALIALGRPKSPPRKRVMRRLPIEIFTTIP
ncbi:MAG TPA: nitroreductase family protein [Bacteroidetes bacterium]|nr:nitroreductase family protein [Bacteroidota bacterium]